MRRYFRDNGAVSYTRPCITNTTETHGGNKAQRCNRQRQMPRHHPRHRRNSSRWYGRSGLSAAVAVDTQSSSGIISGGLPSLHMRHASSVFREKSGDCPGKCRVPNFPAENPSQKLLYVYILRIEYILRSI